ncbi:MAG: hypothetical protein Q6370_015120 [Candidatus Sigynarchaeota archaeon]
MTKGGRTHKRHGLLQSFEIPVQEHESVDRELSKDISYTASISKPDDIAAERKAHRWTASTRLGKKKIKKEENLVKLSIYSK